MTHPIVSTIANGRPRCGDRFVDLSGRRFATNLGGKGKPTVVFETGLGAESAEWAAVQDAIEPLTRVFRYDRSGRGGSDPAPGPRTALQMVEDLRLLLRLSGLPGPYLLVGHSFGGLIARLFAFHYPDEVAGLVLVDSMHEDQFEAFAPMFPPPAAGEPAELTAMRSFWTQGWRDPDATAERIDMVASRRQGHEITGLGDLPMRVLVAGSWSGLALAPEPVRVRLQALWGDLQDRLAGLSTRAQVVEAPASGHFMQRDAPQAVADAIRSLLEELRP